MAATRYSFHDALFRTASAAALLATGVLVAGAARAQGNNNGDVETVTVTGSRIGTPGFQTPTPVTEITPLQYEVKEMTSLVDLQADIPSLTPNQAQSSVTDVGGSNFNLRNLGAVRTLNLINGLRTEATSVNGGFDINTLPASLIQHIDIVTGGASAAYGSDAVAGVINVVLNTTLDGLRAKAGWGESYYGDDQTLTGSLAYGTAFAGGRGHIVVGGDYFSNQGVLAQNTRPWGNQDWGLIPDPNCTTITATCFNYYITKGVISSNTTEGGVITSAGPLQNIQFGPGGVPEPFTKGAFAGGTFMIGGSGSRANATQGTQAAITRANFLTNASYDITDDLNVWGRFMYSKSSQFYPIIPSFSTSITITNQNPFIPASILATMTASKITQFVMGRSNEDIGPIHLGRDLTYGRNEDYDGIAGVKGQFDGLGSTWSWDVNAEYFSNEYRTLIAQNLNNTAFNNSVDAIANPAVGAAGHNANLPAGAAICRSTVTNPANGCVAVNLFGPNTITPDAQAYFEGTSYVDAQLDMFDTSANIKGQPFSTWAGPVSLATGFEYRRQSTNSSVDSLSLALVWKQGNATPYKGAYSVEEGYLETDIPLAKDLPFAKAADVNAAVRLTSYSTSGGVTTWKVGANYSPTDEFRLRATRSHDIRAPDLQDLFQTGVLRTAGSIINPATNVQNSPQTITSGNPNLLPEIGDTITAGIVYSPSWTSGLNFSIDYWHIIITHGIGNVGAQQVVNNCLEFGLTAYCPAISYSPVNGQITVVASEGFNQARLMTDGWDFEAGYQFDMDDLVSGWAGRLQLHALATYLIDYQNTSFGVYTNTAGGIANGVPRLRYSLNAIYLNDPWTLSLTGNWQGGGPFNALYNNPDYTYAQGGRTIANNEIGGRFYVNVSVAYQLNESWQAYGRVTNLLNVAPPIVPNSNLYQQVIGGTDEFDRVGPQFLMGVKLSLDN